METSNESNLKKYISEKDVYFVLKEYGTKKEDSMIKEYTVRKASENMMGLLADYWKLKIILENGKELQFFLKVMSKVNPGKADMVKEMNLFEGEIVFYSKIKPKMQFPDIKPWSARLVAVLGDNDIMVFEDLNLLGYNVRNKFLMFDIDHTILALKTLARYHAGSIIYEEKRSKEIGRVYTFFEEFEKYFGDGGYATTSVWYNQSMDAGLEAIKVFSKRFNKRELQLIEERWEEAATTGVHLSCISTEHRNVVCHRDLWNNNMLFRYKNVNNQPVPDSCVLVDFQGIRYQPPAGDIMFLLCNNLDPKVREGNLEAFISAYLDELGSLLSQHGVVLEDVIPKHKFYTSIEQQRQFGLITYICIMSLIWISDELMNEIAYDTVKFNNYHLEDRVGYTLNMMNGDPVARDKFLEVFEEYAERYCLNSPVSL